MGMEDFGKKPVAQGEAGFLTQEQLDEVSASPVAEVAPVAKTKERWRANADGTFTKLEAPVEQPAATEQQVMPLSPERNAEVMEEIDQQESRLNSNLAANQIVLEAAEKKMADPAAQKAEVQSKWLLNRAKINGTYDKAKSKINELSLLAFIGGGGLMASSMIPGSHAEVLKNSENVLDNIAASDWSTIATHMAESGVGVAAAAGGIWAISRTMNWLSKRSKEKKNYEEYRDGLNRQTA